MASFQTILKDIKTVLNVDPSVDRAHKIADEIRNLYDEEFIDLINGEIEGLWPRGWMGKVGVGEIPTPNLGKTILVRQIPDLPGTSGEYPPEVKEIIGILSNAITNHTSWNKKIIK